MSAELPPPPAATQAPEVHAAGEARAVPEIQQTAATASVDDWRVAETPPAGSGSAPIEPPATFDSEAYGSDPVVAAHRDEPLADSAPVSAPDATPAVADVEQDQSPTGDGYTDPVDEPPAELLLSYEERQLAECDRQVFVIDGRPRFHLVDCPHLADKSGQPLVISEAAELGFTSCSLCTAATTVLAERK